MHDKTIRRRRAVLLALVVGCLLLLTASFGASPGGGLRTVQGGVSEVVSPVQEGASQALKPIRDGVGWFGDTFDAKGENEKLRKELALARRTKADIEEMRRQNDEFRRMLELDARVGLEDLGLVPARIFSSSPNVINQVVKLNKGSSDGVRVGQPVVTADGLLGRVDSVQGGSSIVELVTDADFGARVRISEKGIPGVVRPASGAPRSLRMLYTEADDDVRVNDTVVTSGTADPAFPSPFPSGVPIGRVVRVDDPGSDSQDIRVKPFVNPRDVEYVQIVTDVGAGDRS